MRAFNPYAKGIPEKKEHQSRIESKWMKQKTEEKPSPPPSGPVAGPAQAPAMRRQSAEGNGRPSAQERDVIDGLEHNLRRQRGWDEDSKPNEIVDGISITPISRAELQKKIAAQKKGGFFAGNP